jgi:DNA-binding NarL/FixJ family response regulator
MNNTKIFLADDHTMVREGLKYILSNQEGFKVIGEAGDGREALAKIEKLKPDVAVIDISLPSMTGIEITRQLKKYQPEIKIIILTRHNNEEYLFELLKYNIDSYILKDNASDELIHAINEVTEGNAYFSSRITKTIVSNYSEMKKENTKKSSRGDNLLSPREKEILKLIAEGMTNKEISSVLFISEYTVKAHKTNIMKKLDVHKTNGLIKYAIKTGLVEP